MTLGPLDGTIVSIKDLFDVAGEATRAGSKVLVDAPPGASDALPLPRAGALPVGLMLVARNGHDRRLFRMAAAVERLFSAWQMLFSYDHDSVAPCLLQRRRNLG